MKKFNTFVRPLDFLSPSFYLRFPCINHSTQSFSTSSILAKNKKKKKRVSDPEAAEIKINKSKSKFIRKAVTKEAESLKKYILNKYSEMIVNYINPLRKQERINFINKKLGLVHKDQLTIWAQAFINDVDGKLFEPLKYTNLCLYLSIVNLDKWTPDQEKRLHLFTAVFVNDKKLPFNPSSHNQNSEGRIIVCINKEYGVRVIEKNINGTNILFIHPLIFFNPLNNCIQKIVRGSPVIFKMERGWGISLVKFLFTRLNIILSGGGNSTRWLLNSAQVEMSQFITDWFSHATARKVSTLSYNTHARDRKLRTSNIDSTHPFDKFILDDGDLSEIHLESSQIQKGLEDTSQELLCRVDKQASDKKNKLLHDQGISSRRCFHSTRTILKETLLPTYLSSIKEIINMADKAEAQKDIEKKWLSLAKESVDGVKQIHKHRFDVIDDLRISLAKASVNSFRYIPAVLRKYVGGDESLLIAVAMISNTVRAVSETHLALLIGWNIFLNIYNKHFSEGKHRRKSSEVKLLEGDISTHPKPVQSKTSKKNKNLDSWLAYHGLNREIFIKLGEQLILLLHYNLEYPFIDRVFTRDIGYVVSISPKYMEMLKSNIVIKPQALPMICPPLRWGKRKIGGYMLPETAGPVGVNREGGTNFIPTIRKSIVTGSEQHDHEIKAENSTKLYKCINLLNGMGFKVNSDLLDYLKTSAGSHLLELNLDSKSEKERTQLEMINSNCLAIAETYRDQTFYFNTFIDWRGRIYTHAFYLDYQGSELSLALIHMALGKQLSPKGKFYLMVYGANCYNYGGNLKKQSLEDRVKWISDNEESVLSLNPSFIKKAENPILFTAFALEYIKHHKNSSAKIYLPIFLDSTCSGIQHLAAMLGDRKLAADVNLIPNVSKVNGETPVKDVYSNALKKLNHKLSSSVQDKKECFDMIQIREVSLTRKILKKALMTKVYGVTIYGIFDQLKSSFSREIEEVVDSSGEKTKIYVYYAPSKLPGHVKLSSNQLFKLARIISENLFKFNPALEELYDYLSSTVKLMVKLNIPIVWSTPAGLIVKQDYKKSIVKKCQVNILGNRKEIVLREWQDKTDTKKQKMAVIPNIVHSMDASHLINIILGWVKNPGDKIAEDKACYLIPIHDCFGTHPNDMEDLFELVKDKFITLYKKDFLSEFHKNLLTEIERFNLETINSDGETFVRNPHVDVDELDDGEAWMRVPKLPERRDFNIEEVKKSRYMIT